MSEDFVIYILAIFLAFVTVAMVMLAVTQMVGDCEKMKNWRVTDLPARCLPELGVTSIH